MYSANLVLIILGLSNVWRVILNLSICPGNFKLSTNTWNKERLLMTEFYSTIADSSLYMSWNLSIFPTADSSLVWRCSSNFYLRASYLTSSSALKCLMRALVKVQNSSLMLLRIPKSSRTRSNIWAISYMSLMACCRTESWSLFKKTSLRHFMHADGKSGWESSYFGKSGW